MKKKKKGTKKKGADKGIRRELYENLQMCELSLFSYTLR